MLYPGLDITVLPVLLVLVPVLLPGVHRFEWQVHDMCVSYGLC